MNPLALAALATAIIATNGKQVHPIWQNETRLRQYQVAWTSLNKSTNVTYYQVSATELMSVDIYTNHGQQPKAKLICWSVKMSNLDQGNETGVREYSYTYAGANSEYFINEEVKTVSMLNYSIKNAVQYEYTKGETHADPVIFTDGKMCDLLNVPKASSKDGCELWVNSDYKDNVPPCCSFIYDLLCAVEKSYDIYDKQQCKSVVQSLEKKFQ
uniref:Lipocalin n=1 Tax=Rhipicephalus appendiculatus TaxID=34631 RepID=A0A131Z747_RHIAP